MTNDLQGYPPRGMGRVEAARYLGISPAKFDQLVADRRMPQPKQIDGRLVWDRMGLDATFSELPDRATGGLREKAERLEKSRKG
jgi:predicted DNA-binding transcriptional regulator AlpA